MIMVSIALVMADSLCFVSGVLFGTTMIMVSIALVMAVIVTNLYLRKDSERRVPLCVRRIFLGRSKVRKNSIPLTPKLMLNDNNHIPHHNNDHKFHHTAEGIEIDNISNISEMDGLTCPNDRCFKRRRTLYKTQDMETSAMISYEWQQLARMVDRICFWLFLFSSIAALTTMFSQIPQYNATWTSGSTDLAGYLRGITDGSGACMRVLFKW